MVGVPGWKTLDQSPHGGILSQIEQMQGIICTWGLELGPSDPYRCLDTQCSGKALSCKSLACNTISMITFRNDVT